MGKVSEGGPSSEPRNYAVKPLLPGPPDLIAGYRVLHDQEAKYAQIALREMPGAVAVWYRLLTLYDQAIRREHEFSGDDQDLPAWHLLLYLANVAGGTSKLVLDAALVGYYTQGFALVRHMLESWRQMVYVVIRPGEAHRWFKGPDGSNPREPRENTISNALLQHSTDKDLVRQVNHTIKALRKSAHPSGLAFGQTQTGREGFAQFGANYQRELCVRLIDWGTFATLILLREVSRAVPVSDAWLAEWQAVAKERARWLAAERESRQG